jgi:hypothetical protein
MLAAAVRAYAFDTGGALDPHRGGDGVARQVRVRGESATSPG